MAKSIITSAKIRIADQNLKDCFAGVMVPRKATELSRKEYISVPKIAYPENRSEQETQSEQNFIRQKYLFYNRCRFKRCVIGAITCLFLLIYPLTACAGETNPVPKEGLPWGVFPLNDVRWVYLGGEPYEYSYTVRESATDSTDSVCVHKYGQYMDTTTYFVRQIAENQAEIHSSKVRLEYGRYEYDFINKVESKFPDTTYIVDDNQLEGRIFVEDKKVYFQPKDGTKSLMYDFSLKVGDIFYVGSSEYFLLSIDSIQIWNEYRKKYNFAKNKEQNDAEFSVVEGIGSLSDFFNIIYYSGPVSFPLMNWIYYKNNLIWTRYIGGK